MPMEISPDCSKKDFTNYKKALQEILKGFNFILEKLSYLSSSNSYFKVLPFSTAGRPSVIHNGAGAPLR
ncbi:hypothetical protein SAMN06295967_10551 [Belliella buryatensis]|uniref:Uncharacterized protein n=1 Tax=Belliella buryatensis TaxID=1500549 RepID=A0A239CJR9_9BACT|nr:hypothetical protein SAMN06295967_10551 [Belliella buryatensis]